VKKALSSLIFILALAVSSCSPISDATGPVEKLATDLVSTQAGIQADLSRSTVNALVQADDAGALETLRATFVAVAGERQSFRIRYLMPAAEGGPSPHFFRLDLHHRTLIAHPDGTPIAEGESVVITVTIDPSDLRVELEPSGLRFNPDEPAELRLSYHRANPDLDGDGDVDLHDADLENNLLGLWVRPGAEDSGEDWTLLGEADQDLVDKDFKAEIEHFSGYVVAW